MKVILLADVKSVGKKGETVTVADGYGRNVLLAKKLGVEATAQNMNNLKLQKANEEKLAKEQAEQFRNNPQALVDWIKENIVIKNELNARNIPMAPTSVLKSMITDSRSRNIFFVSMARSLGIASRIDPVTGKVQYLAGKDWIAQFNLQESDVIVIEVKPKLRKLEEERIYIKYKSLFERKYYVLRI